MPKFQHHFHPLSVPLSEYARLHGFVPLTRAITMAYGGMAIPWLNE